MCVFQRVLGRDRITETLGYFFGGTLILLGYVSIATIFLYAGLVLCPRKSSLNHLGRDLLLFTFVETKLRSTIHLFCELCSICVASAPPLTFI